MIVLDMARHVPLYQAVLVLIRCLAKRQSLVKLLLSQTGNNSEPLSQHEGGILPLLAQMKTCVDTYASRLR